jgi:hypothetical protein
VGSPAAAADGGAVSAGAAGAVEDGVGETAGSAEGVSAGVTVTAPESGAPDGAGVAGDDGIAGGRSGWLADPVVAQTMPAASPLQTTPPATSGNRRDDRAGAGRGGSGVPAARAVTAGAAGSDGVTATGGLSDSACARQNPQLSRWLRTASLSAGVSRCAAYSVSVGCTRQHRRRKTMSS